MTYEIRRAGQTVCFGSTPDLGYPTEMLKAMERAGHYLYCDGKRVKKPPRNGNSKCGAGTQNENHQPSVNKGDPYV